VPQGIANLYTMQSVGIVTELLALHKCSIPVQPHGF